MSTATQLISGHPRIQIRSRINTKHVFFNSETFRLMFLTLYCMFSSSKSSECRRSDMEFDLILGIRKDCSWCNFLLKALSSSVFLLSPCCLLFHVPLSTLDILSALECPALSLGHIFFSSHIFLLFHSPSLMALCIEYLNIDSQIYITSPDL